MTVQAGDSLAEKIRRGASEAKESALTSMTALQELATSLDMGETAARLGETREKLRSDVFKLMMVGRFNSGKSTLLNALMGGTTHPVDLGGHLGPMVVDDYPATALLTGVRYAEKPYVKAWGFDGSATTWALSKYLQESTIDDDKDESQRRFGHIKEFEMGFPAALCSAGVAVYDSPGLDDEPFRTAVTRDAAKRCDAAVMLYRGDTKPSLSEIAESTALIGDGTRIFTLINLWNGQKVDDRLRGHVWTRYVHEQLGGPAWAGQDLSQHDIYFVDADRARTGIYTGQPDLVATSGLRVFEERLGQFLTTERQQAHLSRFVKQADNLLSGIDQQITQRQFAARTDQEQLRETAKVVLPKLEELQRRPTRLPLLTDRARASAEEVLVTSFTSLVARIRQDLPEHLESTKLASESKVQKIVLHKRMQAEASAVVSDFVTTQIAEWSVSSVPELLEPVLDRLGNDVESEISQIGQQLDALNVELTGWQVDATSSGEIVPMGQRILWGATGFLFGDLTAGVTGGAAGWQGGVGGIGGAVASIAVLTVLGVGGAVVIPVAMLSALAAGSTIGSKSLMTRLRKKVLADVEPILRALPDEAKTHIAEQVAAKFDEVRESLQVEISAIIEEEARNIRDIIDLNQHDQSERDRALRQLETAAARLASNRQALQQAVTTVRQSV